MSDTSGRDGQTVQQGETAVRFVEESTDLGWNALRTLRDLIVRPKAVLEAYETMGPSAGGRYAQAVRLFMSLNGVSMVLFFFFGGMAEMLRQAIPPEEIAALAGKAGKSVDLFVADFDQWASLVLVPVVAAALAAVTLPFLKLWSGRSWPVTISTGFSLLTAWTIPVLLLSPIIYLDSTSPIGTILISVLFAVTFLRLGGGRWFQGPVGAVGKTALLLVVQFAAMVGANMIIWGIGMAGALL